MPRNAKRAGNFSIVPMKAPPDGRGAWLERRSIFVTLQPNFVVILHPVEEASMVPRSLQVSLRHSSSEIAQSVE